MTVLFKHDFNIVKTSNKYAQEPSAKFRKTTVIDLKVDVLNWWRTHRREMAILAGLARGYYCLPASSEGAFSEA